MNIVLQYDVTDIQVSHNNDGTLHVVFTVLDCPKQRSSDEVRSTRISPVTHTRPWQEDVKQEKRASKHAMKTMKTMSILGELIFIEPLSEREQEVLEVLAQGASNQEIAYTLTIAPNTVKRHVRAILAKLNVSNRTQAVARALHLELLPKRAIEAS